MLGDRNLFVRQSRLILESSPLEACVDMPVYGLAHTFLKACAQIGKLGGSQLRRQLRLTVRQASVVGGMTVDESADVATHGEGGKGLHLVEDPWHRSAKPKAHYSFSTFSWKAI